MPKYFDFKVAGYNLYFTSHCIVEAIHTHASDDKLTESGSAKIWIHSDGNCTVQKKGKVSDTDINKIIKFIHKNYKSMYESWIKGGGKPEFKEK